MGCEKFRDGSLGVGGVRASMERRWLINAKTTVMRQKKWQEVREQKEQEQVKKVAEILEKRKRQRARMAAYIHMQPAKCAANAAKLSRTENKRSNCNSFLMEDQEIIMKFRERSAGAHNNHKANLASDNLWQGSEKFQLCGAYTNSYIKGYHSPDQNLVICPRYMEDNSAFENFNNPEKYHIDTDQRSEVSAAKCSIKSEPVRHTNWSPEASTYVSLAEGARGQPVATNKRLGDNAHEKENDAHMAIQSENAVHAPQKKNKHLAICKLAESYAETYSATSNSTTLREDETTARCEPRCDLRHEILKARQANEAATARLMAEVNAIESRLEDCNLSLKPLDSREAETDGVKNELNRYTSDTDPLYCDSPGETDSNFSSDSDEVTSGLSTTLSKRAAVKNNNSNGKSQCKEVIMETAANAASNPQPPSDIDWNTVTVGSLEICHEMNMANTETMSIYEVKGKPDEDPKSMSTLRTESNSQSPKPSRDLDWNIDTAVSPESDIEPGGFQATKEVYTHQKYVNEANSAVTSEEKLETNARTSKDSSLVWDIDWDTPKERCPQKNMDYSQSNQQVSPSPRSARERKLPTKQNSIQQELTEDTRSLREERRRFESFHRRPPTIPEGGGNMFRTEVDMLPLPLHNLNFGFSQSIYRTHIQTESLHPTYPHENNAIHAPSGCTRTIDTIGDKENYRKIQSGALTEEEEKIFASLERLDWKLAALQARSVSSGRDSFASQGDFSTKSAPAVMGPPIKKLGLIGLHCAKKPLPYSTVPTRPLTPQSHRPPTGFRRRHQVGLTNMCAGKPSLCRPKYPTGISKGIAPHSDVGSGKWLSSGKIVCHQNAMELFDATAAC